MRKNKRKMLSTTESVKAAITYLIEKTTVFGPSLSGRLLHQNTEEITNDENLERYIIEESESKYIVK